MTPDVRAQAKLGRVGLAFVKVLYTNDRFSGTAALLP
jgi:hypothetical protein